MVPAPTNCPMPDKQGGREGKCRLLSLYARPWVLDRRFASVHVPHLNDLDIAPDLILTHDTGVRGQKAHSSSELPGTGGDTTPVKGTDEEMH